MARLDSAFGRWAGPLQVVAVVAVAACSGSGTAGPDAAAGLDGNADSAPAVPATCDGACQTMTLTANFAGGQATFDRAYYGLTVSGGTPTVYVEAMSGGSPGCPTMDSPPPAHSLIIGEVALADHQDLVSSTANLIDLSGELLPGAPTAASQSGEAAWRARAICPSCVGQPAPSDPDGIIALEVAYVFAEGTLGGHVFATHCDSFDVVE